MKREKKEKAPKPKKEKKQKAPRPKKEKKQKKPRKGKKGAAPELENPEAEGLETGKKSKKKKLLIPILAVAAAAAVFFFIIRPRFFAGDKPEEPPPPPEPIETPQVYTMGETEVHALPVWGDGLVYLVEDPVPVIEEPPAEEPAPAEEEPAPAGDAELEAPTWAEADPQEEASDEEDAAGEEEEASAEEEAEPKEPTVVGYRYEELNSPGTLVQVYTTLMTAKDVGFSRVDGELTRLEEPEDPALEGGTIRLAKNAPEEGMAMCILLDWTEELCTVTFDLVDGRVKNPPAPVTPMGPMGMSADEIEDYIGSLDPAVLGLEGTSMDDYELLIQDGSVLIDGNPCVRVNAYYTDPNTGTYGIGGNYFISLDGSHLYLLDVASDSVSELAIPPR